MNDLKDELGDLLFQVMFHAQIAKEQNLFNINDVINHVTAKMIFRHPHVFEDDSATDAKEVETTIWEMQKQKEKLEKRNADGLNYYLDDVTRHLPSLLLANKIQKRIRKVGFQYSSLYDTLDKLFEEIEELKTAYEDGENHEHIKEEFGDILFIASLLGEEIGANPEECLRQSCFKFIKRFNAVETILKEHGSNLNDASIDQMTHAWNLAKDDN
jgi:MazG family protein